jgi:uncharacterized protein (TIGR03435 family)
MTMSGLANALSLSSPRPVVDRTGLAGRFDIWMLSSGFTTSNVDSTSADIFTALKEQLGLRLEPDRGPIESWVVEHAERPTID